jgi:hypothetical protein
MLLLPPRYPHRDRCALDQHPNNPAAPVSVRSCGACGRHRVRGAHMHGLRLPLLALTALTLRVGLVIAPRKRRETVTNDDDHVEHDSTSASLYRKQKL